MATDETTVAIACQGGGSHTAFTAGALAALFDRFPDGYALHGFSGTSGGAITAAVAWDAFRDGGPSAVGERVGALWDDIAAAAPAERAFNAAGVWWTLLETGGAPLPEFSPYANPYAWLGRQELRTIIDRHADFDRSVDSDDPWLFVSAVDVLSGTFETFGRATVSTDVLLASASAPYVFPAYDLDGRPHWDGLFARNPPIKPFLDRPATADAKPDELWIVQVNPDERPSEPRSLRAIADRRSELSGNVSLSEQVAFVEKVNDWVAEGWLPRELYKEVTVRWLSLDEQLPFSSRFDRDPALLAELRRTGRETAAAFRRELPEQVRSVGDPRGNGQ